MSKQSFYAWRQRLAQQEAQQQPESPRVEFAPVAVLPEQPESRGRSTPALSITIHLPGEVRIELAGAVDRQALGEVLAALHTSQGREASC